MITVTNSPLVSVEEYLHTESQSDIKREYARGKLYAMVGVSDHHVLITGNAYSLLKNHLRGRGYLTFFTDTRLRIESQDLLLSRFICYL